MKISTSEKSGFVSKITAGWPFILLVVSLLTDAAAMGAETAAPANDRKVRIVLAGDSTVTTNAGWGTGFANCLATNVECINLSRGARSSKSFIAEGRWKECLDLKPDYILIQFGHNDQPGHGPDRETDPQTTYRQFMTQYVDDAKAAGIKPVLVTPMSRRQWGSDGKIHSALQPWADVVKEVASAKNVPLIDLHARAIELYEKLGKEKILEISPRKNADAASTNSDSAAKLNRGYDGTHLNEKGSALVGPIVAAELSKVVPELAPYLRCKTGGIVVAADGSGDYRTVQEAVAVVPDNGTDRTVIHIKPGTYQGPIVVPKSKSNVTLEGEDAHQTVLTYPYNVKDSIPEGSDKFNPGVQILAENFRAQNITFQNTSGDHGQALALRVDSDRVIFKNCRMLGWQDTLMINNGRQYFKGCYIEGRVDFIYGSATAVFDQCEIHSKNGGHVTAASTPQDHRYGFVFLNCRLTGDPNPWIDSEGKPANKSEKAPLADLGRPWRPFASVTYVNCEMGDHIKLEGWNNWRNPTNETTARYAEYKSTGPGANPDARVKWARQLPDDEAKSYTVETILRGADGWNPSD